MAVINRMTGELGYSKGGYIPNGGYVPIVKYDDPELYIQTFQTNTTYTGFNGNYRKVEVPAGDHVYIQLDGARIRLTKEDAKRLAMDLFEKIED